MPPVPAVCSALADQVAAIEAEEASLRAALANLTGFAAWTTLVRLSRIQDDLDKFRQALARCVEHADAVFPGELVVMDVADAEPSPATDDRVVQLWEVTSSGATVRDIAPVTGTFFPLTRPLPQQFGITVLTADMAGVAAGTDLPCDFRSAPVSPAAVPSGGPLRVEVALGPRVRFTAAQVNAWVGEAFPPHDQPLSGGVVDVVVSVTGASASLVDGGIRGMVTGSLSFRGNPLLGAVTVPFSIGVGVSVRLSMLPLSHIVELASLGPPEIHLAGDLGAFGTVLSTFTAPPIPPG